MNPFFKWLTGKRDASRAVDISCAECVAAWQEVAVRELCLQSCIDMVANAIGRCEVRTFAGGREVQDREYYMLNVEPNVNQNSSAFWHKVISQLYRHNEALIINTTTRDGRECLVCADSFYQDGDYPAKMNTYKGVVVGQVAYNKTFRENEVIHLKLNERNIRPVLEALASSYDKLISAAEAYYVAANGVHIKAHVDAIAQQATGDDLTAWQAAFAESLKKVVVPFLQSGNGVLPEGGAPPFLCRFLPNQIEFAPPLAKEAEICYNNLQIERWRNMLKLWLILAVIGTVILLVQVAVLFSGPRCRKAAPVLTSSGYTGGEDGLCPLCHAPLEHSVIKEGRFQGREFLNCTRFPKCKFFRKLN